MASSEESMGGYAANKPLEDMYQKWHVLNLPTSEILVQLLEFRNCKEIMTTGHCMATPRSYGKNGLHIPHPPLYFNSKMCQRSDAKLLPLKLFTASNVARLHPHLAFPE